ncbi:hypothetical protein ACN47E_010081 [Coniothyrium glycines]
MIPSAKASATISSAHFYKAVNSAYGKRYLVVYRVPDVSAAGGVLKDLHAGLEEEGKICWGEGGSEGVEWDGRVFGVTQVCQGEAYDVDVAFPTLMLALMQPGAEGAQDLEKWYREEHNQQMSEQPGWKRTTRYSLIEQASASGVVGPELSFLAMHEFGQGHRLGTEVEALQPVSGWTERVLRDAVGIDAAIYDRVDEW